MTVPSGYQSFTCVGYIQPTWASLDANNNWAIRTTPTGKSQIKFAIRVHDSYSDGAPMYFPVTVFDKTAKYFSHAIKPGDLVSILGSWNHLRQMYGGKIKDFFFVIASSVVVLRKHQQEYQKPGTIPWDTK
jgi:hypothetical protein